MDLKNIITISYQRRKVKLNSSFFNDVSYFKCLMKDGVTRIEFSHDLKYLFSFFVDDIYDSQTDARQLYSEGLKVRKLGIEFGIVKGSSLYGRMVSYLYHIACRYSNTDEAFAMIELSFGTLPNKSYNTNIAIRKLLTDLLLPFEGETIDIRDREKLKSLYFDPHTSKNIKKIIDDMYDPKNELKLFMTPVRI